MKPINPCVVLNYIVLTSDDPDFEIRSRHYAAHVRRQNRKARRWRFLNRVRNLF